MTKDGRPSRLVEIRYFQGDTQRHSYLECHEEAKAFGNRMAWLLNGEGFSCGAYTTLYILFTPSLDQGYIQVTDKGGDWWQRYVLVGVSKDFPNVSDSSDIVMRETVSALKAVRPDLSGLIDEAGEMVKAHGKNLRFLIKSQLTKKYIVELYCNIPVWGQEPANLYTSLTDRASGVFLEAQPLEIGSYGSAFDYAGPLKITEIEEEISDFVPRARPVMSKLIKRRG